jgi:hypothetical protein
LGIFQRSRLDKGRAGVNNGIEGLGNVCIGLRNIGKTPDDFVLSLKISAAFQGSLPFLLFFWLDMGYVEINFVVMESFISYFSLVALILVLILLTWAIILMYQERLTKRTARSRLADLRKRVEALPEETDEEKTRKNQLHRELNLEYLDNILGEIEKVQTNLAKKAKEAKKTRKKSKA